MKCISGRRELVLMSSECLMLWRRSLTYKLNHHTHQISGIKKHALSVSFHSYLFQWLREPEFVKSGPTTFGLWATIYTPNFRHKKTRFHSYLFQWLREPELIKGEPTAFGLWATIYTLNFRHKKTRFRRVVSFLFMSVIAGAWTYKKWTDDLRVMSHNIHTKF